MIWTVEQDDAVIIRDFPLSGWFVGLAAILVGGILASSVIGLALRSQDDPSFSWTDSRLWFFFCFPAIVIGFGIWFSSSRPITTTVVDRSAGTITISQKRVMRSSMQTLKFDDVKDITVRSVHVFKQGPTYIPELNMKYGDTIDLTDSGLQHRGKAYDIVDLINKFIKPKSEERDFKLTIINDD